MRGLVALAIVGLPLLAAMPAWADASQGGTASAPVTATTAVPSTTMPLVPTPGAVAVPTATPPSTPPTSVASTAPPSVPIPHTGTTIIGSGSSFAGPEVLQWTADTAKSPYNLTVDYTSTSSGDGRFNFGNNTVDFAVSDIPYQSTAADTKQPTFPFIYVPVTAGGLAFMYNIAGLTKTLQLSSYSACAIMTGGVKMWNDPVIAADNPGVNLPAIAIHPVIRSDLAGTNFVMQEYCIHLQPALWKAFVTSSVVVNNPSQVGDLSATDPRSDWPIFPTGIEAVGSAAAANDVAVPNDNGYITAVETAYAIQRNFPTASVKNASGTYTQPDPVNVASALAYATQNSDGTHNLNFDGAGPHVYNPSTYSYLLTPTTGWSAAKGSVMSQFANYALTIGQQKATEIGYASLGLSLEQYGVNAMKQQVPGAVALTAQEQNSYACGDLTVPEVQAGQTQPTCGVLNTNSSSNPNQAASGGTSRITTTTKGTTASRSRTSTGSSGNGSSGTGVDPGVSLGTNPALAVTGASPLPIVLSGAAFVTIGWLVRRRLRTRMQ
jgi:phosphate transport system substrate-binding protein